MKEMFPIVEWNERELDLNSCDTSEKPLCPLQHLIFES